MDKIALSSDILFLELQFKGWNMKIPNFNFFFKFFKKKFSFKISKKKKLNKKIIFLTPKLQHVVFYLFTFHPSSSDLIFLIRQRALACYFERRKQKDDKETSKRFEIMVLRHCNDRWDFESSLTMWKLLRRVIRSIL